MLLSPVNENGCPVSANTKSRTSFAELAERALRAAGDEGTPHTADFLFERCRIRMHTNSAELVRYLRSYFEPFLAEDAARTEPIDITMHAVEGEPLDTDAIELGVHPPESGKHRVKEEYVDLDGGRLVRKRLTGMVFLFNEEVSIASGKCLDNANQIVNFINNRFIEWSVKRGWALCHAAGVMTKDEQGVVIAGVSGAGKSTLSLHLVSRGLDFVSNDRILIRRQPAERVEPDAVGTTEVVRMVGVAKLPRINPGTILHNPDLVRMLEPEDKARYEALPSDELWALEEKYDAPIEGIYGPGRFHLAGDVVGVYILNWSRTLAPGHPTIVRRVDLGGHITLLEALMKRLGVFYFDRTAGHEPEDRPDHTHYLEILRDIPAYEVSGRLDFDVAAEAIESRLLGNSD